MPSLTDKLKALGVKTGAQGLPAPKAPSLSTEDAGLESLLNGSYRSNPMGRTFVVEGHYPRGQAHGQSALTLREVRRSLARWAGDDRLGEMPVEAFAFLDTETTGLSGGAGTLAFLIGVGRFIGDEFVLTQFFLRDPLEEPGQLAALEEFLAPCQAIVTFNGKAFDAPLLMTRYTTHGWKAPLNGMAHLDLLHLARRLWRDRLPSRTLGNLEVQILGAVRTEEDIPGWDIPRLYQDYLRTGDATELKRVFYHNAMDVISLAALMDHMAGLLDDPLEGGGRYGVDLLSLARLFEDLGDLIQASQLYLYGLEHEDAQSDRIPRAVLLQAIGRLAAIHKRQAEWDAAIRLWEQAAARRQLEACIELAKCYEHSLKDAASALRWTEIALEMVESASTRPSDEFYMGLYERRQMREALLHRRERLNRKLP